MTILLKFLILYSPFILIGFLILKQFVYFTVFSYFTFSSLFTFLVALTVPSYIVFCIFHYFRAIVLAAKKANKGKWRIAYSVMLLITTIGPAVLTFMTFGYLFGQGTLILRDFALVIQCVLALAAFVLCYNRHDLLDENSTPILGQWAYNLGQNAGYKRYEVV